MGAGERNGVGAGDLEGSGWAVGNGSLHDQIEEDGGNGRGKGSSRGGVLYRALWNGGSSFDAWMNAASTQVAQVLLTLPYSFSQLGMVSGIFFQIFYGLMGAWTCYLITCLYADYRARKEKENPAAFEKHTIQWFEVLGGLLGPRWRMAGLVFNGFVLFCTATIQLIACASNVYYLNDHLDKRTWTYIFGASFMITILVPAAHNYRVLSAMGITMTTYTAWFLTISAAKHGQIPNVQYKGSHHGKVAYFTGATNILYTFGGHAVTVEMMHSMWKPRRFKVVYLVAVLYIFTLTIPSAVAMYWAFGDKLFKNANAFAVLPKTKWRDAAVVLMLGHQFFEYGMVSLPLYIMWEKLVGVHGKHYLVTTISRVPVVMAMWFTALMIPFFGPINSAVGSLFVAFGVYIIPAAAYIAFYKSASARASAVEKPPFFLFRSWFTVFAVNIVVVLWVLVVGFGFGAWASITNIVDQIHTFGLFAKCYQCPKRS